MEKLDIIIGSVVGIFALGAIIVSIINAIHTYKTLKNNDWTADKADREIVSDRIKNEKKDG